MPHRPLVVAAIGLLALALAIPAVAAKPDGTPGRGPGDKGAKAPSIPITLNGTVEAATGDDGDTRYTLTDGGTTYTLDGGPGWYFGPDHPLAPYVGASVTIEGELEEGTTEVDVLSVDGQLLREPGKPPWAGGWKLVGERHPGWTQEKADRHEARFGGCWPPGHCKDKPEKGSDEAPAD